MLTAVVARNLAGPEWVVCGGMVVGERVVVRVSIVFAVR